MTAAILGCDTPSDREQAVSRAAELLRRGGVVVFPTETVYGVGAGVSDERGLHRLREIKSRADGKPFTVHIASPLDVNRYVDLDSSPLLRRLVRKRCRGR